MISREVSRFLIVGLVTVGIDLSFYCILVWFEISVSTAKATGFIIGAVFAYFSNKHWTFRAKGGWRQFLCFLTLYGSALVINVGVNSAMLHFLISIEGAFFIAFLLATGLSAIFNFLGMKLLIFRPIPVQR